MRCCERTTERGGMGCAAVYGSAVCGCAIVRSKWQHMKSPSECRASALHVHALRTRVAEAGARRWQRRRRCRPHRPHRGRSLRSSLLHLASECCCAIPTPLSSAHCLDSLRSGVDRRAVRCAAPALQRRDAVGARLSAVCVGWFLRECAGVRGVMRSAAVAQHHAHPSATSGSSRTRTGHQRSAEDSAAALARPFAVNPPERLKPSGTEERGATTSDVSEAESPQY